MTRAVALAAALVAVWHLRAVLLFLFAGILLGVVLKRLKHLLQERTGWPHQVCLLVCVLGLGILLGLSGWVVAPPLVDQTEALVKGAPEMWDAIQEWQPVEWALGYVEENGDDLKGSMAKQGSEGVTWALGALGKMLFSTVGIVTGVVVILGVGFYLAIEPKLYISGIVTLVPSRWESKVREALQRTGDTLCGWMLGQLGSMAAVGIGVGIGLWALGVPHPLALAVLAGVLGFIPNIGSIAAFIPAALVALAVEPMLAVWVTLLYMGVQAVEGNLITPMLQRSVIAMPPALLLGFQVIIGALAGVPGILVAAPLLAAIVTLVNCLYVEGVLGKEDGGSTV